MCVKNLGMNFVKCIPHKTILPTLCVMFSNCRFYHSLTIRLFNCLAMSVYPSIYWSFSRTPLVSCMFPQYPFTSFSLSLFLFQLLSFLSCFLLYSFSTYSSIRIYQCLLSNYVSSGSQSFAVCVPSWCCWPWSAMRSCLCTDTESSAIFHLAKSAVEIWGAQFNRQ